jgi:flagellar biosynthesis/type III secretory pathway protein FliH
MGRIVRAAETGRGPAPDPARLVAEARAEAAEILSAARREVEQLRSAAVGEGREEGLRAIAAERGELAAERSRLVDEAGEEILRLALRVAAKVLAVAVSDERAVLETARAALARARGAGRLVARVHPADAPAVRAGEARLLALAPRARRLEVREDPGVGRGGVVLETEAGAVDARVEAQLEAIGRSLLEAG